MHWINYALVLGLISLSPLSAAAKPPEKKQPDLAKQVEANNDFAFELYRKLARDKGDLFISPYSISSALAMTSAGTKGNTADEMKKTLHFVLPQEGLHGVFGELTDSLNAAGKKDKFELAVANALWAQNDYAFRDDFLTMVRTNYGAGLELLNFRNETEASRKTINAWVEKQTNDSIKELIKKGLIKRNTVLVLTNSVYFKAPWEAIFQERNTRDEPFTLLNGEKRLVAMMHRTGYVRRYGDFKEDGLQLLELPYEGDRLSMVILLPKNHDGLTQLESQLTAKNLESWIGQARMTDVEIALPKFKMKREFRLDGTLKAMGMKDAFVYRKADFSGMDGTRELFISAAVHQAYIDVNEKGTEAAAGTGIMVAAGGMPVAAPQFIADHPFVFMIRDKASKSILFIGRLVEPEAVAE